MIALPFSPPKVKYKKPQINTMIAFLESKGWIVEEKTQIRWTLKPPKDINLEGKKPFRFYIPTTDTVRDYEEISFRLVESFANLYDLPLQQLFNLLSLSLQEIEEEVKEYPKFLLIKQEMVKIH